MQVGWDCNEEDSATALVATDAKVRASLISFTLDFVDEARGDV